MEPILLNIHIHSLLLLKIHPKEGDQTCNMKTMTYQLNRLSAILPLCIFCTLVAGLAEDSTSPIDETRGKMPVAPGLSVPVDPLGRIGISVFKEQMIYVTSKRTQLLLAIKQGPNATAVYHYRMKTTGDHPEIKGQGRLEEKYREVADAAGNVRLEDVGSDVTIELGDLELEWSHGSQTHSYVYYYPNKCQVYLIDSDTFDQAVFYDH